MMEFFWRAIGSQRYTEEPPPNSHSGFWEELASLQGLNEKAVQEKGDKLAERKVQQVAEIVIKYAVERMNQVYGEEPVTDLEVVRKYVREGLQACGGLLPFYLEINKFGRPKTRVGSTAASGAGALFGGAHVQLFLVDSVASYQYAEDRDEWKVDGWVYMNNGPQHISSEPRSQLFTDGFSPRWSFTPRPLIKEDKIVMNDCLQVPMLFFRVGEWTSSLARGAIAFRPFVGGELEVNANRSLCTTHLGTLKNWIEVMEMAEEVPGPDRTPEAVACYREALKGFEVSAKVLASCLNLKIDSSKLKFLDTVSEAIEEMRMEVAISKLQGQCQRIAKEFCDRYRRQLPRWKGFLETKQEFESKRYSILSNNCQHFALQVLERMHVLVDPTKFGRHLWAHLEQMRADGPLGPMVWFGDKSRHQLTPTDFAAKLQGFLKIYRPAQHGDTLSYIVVQCRWYLGQLRWKQLHLKESSELLQTHLLELYEQVGTHFVQYYDALWKEEAHGLLAYYPVRSPTQQKVTTQVRVQAFNSRTVYI